MNLHNLNNLFLFVTFISVSNLTDEGEFLWRFLINSFRSENG